MSGLVQRNRWNRYRRTAPIPISTRPVRKAAASAVQTISPGERTLRAGRVGLGDGSVMAIGGRSESSAGSVSERGAEPLEAAVRARAIGQIHGLGPVVPIVVQLFLA